MEEDKSGWSEAERQALSFLEEKQPKWRRSYLGPKTEAQVRETFQAISWAAGGETQGLKAIEKNLALMVFLPEQIRASAEALTGELGQKEASDIIQKNPGVLTIPPESIKQNVGAIVPLSSVVGFFSLGHLLVLLLPLRHAVEHGASTRYSLSLVWECSDAPRRS